jgi:hypothetical protein
LPLGGIELVDDAGHAGGEVLDAVAEPVAAGQVSALGGEAGPPVLQFALPCGDRGCAAVQFGHVDQPGLVEVDQPAVFAAGGLEPAVQAGQLGGEQLVVRGRGVRCASRGRQHPHNGCHEPRTSVVQLLCQLNADLPNRLP